TDFGLFTSLDGGMKWIQLKNNLPTIAIKDLEIQKRENDLVIATFGRGFYILDDYSILRSLATPNNQKNKIYPIKDVWLYNESNPLGNDANDPLGTQGDSYYVGQNPPIGAVIRYTLAEVPMSIKQKRKKLEKELIEKGTLKGYPPLDSLMMEDEEILPFYFISIYDSNNQLIKKENISASQGINSY
ncbi:MAG TPA: glycosyl hydrolase, partial [Saprospiraceae bacterium]|nr:glycosyl hydrolase [Saprospiraceae bacterium]